MFPVKGKNDLFKNLAAGWKKGQEMEAMKEKLGAPSAAAAPKMPGAPAMPPAAAPAPAGMPAHLAPMPGMAAPAPQGAPHPMLPMPHNPMLKQSPWLGMKI